MPKIYRRRCDYCGRYYEGRGRHFCSKSCRMKQKNAIDNPAWRPEVRSKLSQAAKGNKRCLGRKLSSKTKAKISESLTGKKQPREVVAKRVASMRATMAKYGGLTPAQRRHLATLHKSGPEHPNWKGGYAAERQKRYNDPQYRHFVSAVLRRDGYRCQWCGARNGHGENVLLQVHHTVPYCDRPDLGYVVSNGLTLCIECHRSAHAGHPRPSDPNYHGRPRTCQACARQFRIKNGRKYCPQCRERYCCPVCGSTNCRHTARKFTRENLPAA